MSLRDLQAGGGGVVGLLARAGLGVLSDAFAVGAWVRGRLYDRGVLKARRVGLPVVSVGNLTAGGTGKTPLVAWLAARAVAAGRRPAVLSRGYGHKPAGSPLSDEGTLLAELLPKEVLLVEDPDRVRGVGRVRAERPATDLALLDDAFQHRRIARDLDVVVLDATNPFGFDQFLPRGLLREPPAALARAGVVVITRVERVAADVLAALRARVAALAPRALVALARTRARRLLAPTGEESPPESLRGTPVLAWSGIGHPAQFEALLGDLGARVVRAIRARDHHAITRRALRAVDEAARGAGATRIVVTRKDLVKLRPLLAGGERTATTLAALDTELEVLEGGDALLARVLAAGLFESPTTRLS